MNFVLELFNTGPDDDSDEYLDDEEVVIVKAVDDCAVVLDIHNNGVSFWRTLKIIGIDEVDF